MKKKYGFLYSGYKPSLFFYELIIQFRKILIIMSSVLLSVISTEAQVLVVLMIIIINVVMHIYLEPYFTRELNRMEVFSLQVASITIYCGMFYVTGSHYTYMENNILKWVFLVCLVVPNVVYGGYWILFFIVELFKDIHKRGRKIFRIATLCLVDYDKFKKRFPYQDVGKDLLYYLKLKQETDKEEKKEEVEEISPDQVHIEIEQEKSGKQQEAITEDIN